MMASAASYAVLALACGAVQLVLTVALLPDRHRVASLRQADPKSAEARRNTPAVFFERIGRAALDVVGGGHSRPGPGSTASPIVARATGAALVCGLCLMPLGPVAAVIGATAGYVVPHVTKRHELRARLAGFAADLPEVVDLVALALGAGLNVPLAVDAVGRRGTGPLSAEMAKAAADARRGKRLADVLDEVALRCGEPVRPLMSVLAAGERYGVPLVDSLDRLATDVRAVQRRSAEEAARRLPVKMLFPLVVCILPAFALLTIGPLLVTSLQTLSW